MLAVATQAHFLNHVPYLNALLLFIILKASGVQYQTFVRSDMQVNDSFTFFNIKNISF